MSSVNYTTFKIRSLGQSISEDIEKQAAQQIVQSLLGQEILEVSQSSAAVRDGATYSESICTHITIIYKPTSKIDKKVRCKIFKIKGNLTDRLAISDHSSEIIGNFLQDGHQIIKVLQSSVPVKVGMGDSTVISTHFTVFYYE